MKKIELQTFLDEVKEEIRVFERPHVDNSKKMFDILSELLEKGKIELEDVDEQVVTIIE